MHTLCKIILPRQAEIVGDKDGTYFAECIRKRCHSGPHVFISPEGKYISWEDDWNCGCCRPEENDRCYTYVEISETDFLALEKLDEQN
ncbi:MAG: hypothetical protein WCJ59_00660 [bacterium]